jgi:MazG family protein
MAHLRDKENGCPWDLKQTHQSIAPHTIEEAYEVADAIDRNDKDDIKDELGDLLLQVVFQAQIASENGDFTFDDVVSHLKEKLIRRHPHIFAQASAKTADDVISVWDRVKTLEKSNKKDAPSPEDSSILDSVPRNFPPMLRAWKLAKKAIKQGFDWPDIRACTANLRDEMDELLYEVENNQPQERVISEMGDIIFSSMTIAAKLNINPEEALRKTNVKFYDRYTHMEASCRKENIVLSELSANKRENLWKKAKKALKNRHN